MNLQQVKTLYHLLKPNRGQTHSERLESFYEGQKADYDLFRQRLLPGRNHLFQQMNKIKSQGIWVDFGAGTGANLDALSIEALQSYEAIHLVDLSPSLLSQAEKKVQERGLNNVYCHHIDILDFKPSSPVDVVSFSFSLTMIPQWFRAVDQAYSILKKKGCIAVVDFYVSEKYPMTGLNHHRASTRHFWPLWFSYDNVFLNSDHLPYLLNHFEKVELFEGQHPLPFMPLGQVPYYSFLGQKA